MNIFNVDNTEFQDFVDNVETIITNVSVRAKDDDITGLHKLIKNFQIRLML